MYTHILMTRDVQQRHCFDKTTRNYEQMMKANTSNAKHQAGRQRRRTNSRSCDILSVPR